MLEKTSSDEVGKDVRKIVRTAFNCGVGAGTETGELPKGRPSQNVTFVTTLKNLYGTIEISDKALRSSQGNEGAFVNILNEEMDSLIKSAKVNFSRMIFGDGTGLLDAVQNVASTYINVMNVHRFIPGMYVRIGEVGECTYAKVTRVAVNNSAVYLSDFSDGQSLETLDTGLPIYIADTNGEELTGLDQIFDSETLYGVERTPEITPETYRASNGQLDEDVVMQLCDNVEAKTGNRPDIILTTMGMRRKIIKKYREQGITLPTVQLENGETGLQLLGMTLIVDRFCPRGTMYLLHTPSFKIHQLCDWQWLEAEDGKILKQVPGKPVYAATLVKYAELMCENPGGQARLSGLAD
jgi:hypothetical protein